MIDPSIFIITVPNGFEAFYKHMSLCSWMKSTSIDGLDRLYIRSLLLNWLDKQKLHQRNYFPQEKYALFETASAEILAFL